MKRCDCCDRFMKNVYVQEGFELCKQCYETEEEK